MDLSRLYWKKIRHLQMRNKIEENNEKKWWELIRNGELLTALESFPKEKNLEVLEIGGRDGYQAELISKKGFKVTSIDIKPIFPQFYPVQKGDITKLDFHENSFDIIFSSNMLQEIHSIDEALLEMKRVLKKDGIIIHIVPSSWWTLITNFWHYCFIPKYLIKSKKIQHIFNSELKKENNNKEISKDESKSSERNLKRLFLHPLGANTSFMHEIVYFSEFYWKKLFIQNGFKIINKKNCPYYYSGYAILKFKFLNFRKIFAKFFPSCYCLVLTKNSIIN